jgi:extracellular factor (EF) 3-hydroxypalmitic acid methyl ester biosynthesis protein
MEINEMSFAMSAPTGTQFAVPYVTDEEFTLAGASVSELRRAVKAFISLDGAPAGYGELYRGVALGIRRMAAAIRECEEAGVAPQEIREHLAPARILHHRSPFVARAQDWPRGYPGDFETIEYLCDAVNRADAGDPVARCIEDYALASDITRQHRNKLELQAEMMLGCCRSKKSARVLSVGCGGARDLRMIAGLLRDCDVELVLCDSDAGALELARAELGPLAVRCTFVHGRVPRVVNRLKSLGTFDLVVAGGLFDYLPDRWISLMVGDVWRHLLNRGGTIFFTNIAAGNPYRPWMEYLADWSLIERTEGDVERLCRDAGVGDGAVSVTRDGTGLTLITKVVKSSNAEHRTPEPHGGTE